MTSDAELHPSTLEALARTAAQAGNLIKAIELARQAIVADPGRMGLLDELATMYAKGAAPARNASEAPLPVETPEVPDDTSAAPSAGGFKEAGGSVLDVDIPLFSSLTPGALESLAQKMEQLDVNAGEKIVEEGEVGERMFVIIEGRVAVHRGQQRLAVLSDGDFFGEVALLTAQPRAASVTALEDTRLFTIDRPLLEGLAREHPAVLKKAQAFAKERLADTALARSEVFSSLPDAERRALARRFALLEAGEGVEVIAPGQARCGLFVVLKGGVKVVTEDEEVAQLGVSEVVGEISTLFGTSTTASVVATGDTLLLHLTPEEVDDALKDAPDVKEALTELGQERWALI